MSDFDLPGAEDASLPLSDDTWPAGALLRAHATPELPDEATIAAAVAIAVRASNDQEALDANGVIVLARRRQAKRLRVLGAVAAVSVVFVGGLGFFAVLLLDTSTSTGQPAIEGALPADAKAATSELAADERANSAGVMDAAGASSSMQAVIVVPSVDAFKNAVATQANLPSQTWQSGIVAADAPSCSGVAYTILSSPTPRYGGRAALVVDPVQNASPTPRLVADSPTAAAESTATEIWIQDGVTTSDQSIFVASTVLLLRADSCQELAVP
jgi:hypothetical protein